MDLGIKIILARTQTVSAGRTAVRWNVAADGLKAFEGPTPEGKRTMRGPDFLVCNKVQ
jgi:hypothetical protein